MTVLEALRWAQEELNDIPDPKLDGEYLLSDVLGLPRLNMLIDKTRQLTETQRTAYRALVLRRKGREPLQYILGDQSFMGFPFRVDPRALIPRQDTETVCEKALGCLKPGMRALDVCTGTGAIAIALKKLCPGADVTATDISADALSLARENAQALQAQVRFAQGDLFTPVAGETFDLIVSNPPYISSALRGRLQPEVEKEPALALFAGEDGLDFYRRIAHDAPNYLAPGGHLVLEIGDGQSTAVGNMLSAGFCDIQVFNDLSGLERGVMAAKKEEEHGSAI